MSHFDMIYECKMYTKGMWQHVYITYYNTTSADTFKNLWAIKVYDNLITATPVNLTETEYKKRFTHKLNLSIFLTIPIPLTYLI